MTRTLPSIVLVIGAAFALTGCGDTKQDVIARFAPQCAAMREKLKDLHAKLPAPGQISEPVERVEFEPPTPVYDAKSKTGNTEIVMDEDLLRPEDDPEFDLMLSLDLNRCLAWAGPESPLAESAKSSAAGSIEEEFKRALSWQYLVVVRVVSYEPPQIVADGKFSGGDASFEAFVFRASDSKLLVAFPFAAKSAENISYSYKPTDSKQERAAAFVKSSAYTAARKSLAEKLVQVTGGQFRFD